MAFVQVKLWLREPAASTGGTPRIAMLRDHFNPFDAGIGPDDETRQSTLCHWLDGFPGFWDGLPAGVTPEGLVRAFALATDLCFWGFQAPDGDSGGGGDIGFDDWLQLALDRPRRHGVEDARRAVAVTLARQEPDELVELLAAFDRALSEVGRFAGGVLGLLATVCRGYGWDDREVRRARERVLGALWAEAPAPVSCGPPDRREVASHLNAAADKLSTTVAALGNAGGR